MGEEGVEGGGEEVRQGQLHMLSGWCITKRTCSLGMKMLRFVKTKKMSYTKTCFQVKGIVRGLIELLAVTLEL